jgi:hypothetical protein
MEMTSPLSIKKLDSVNFKRDKTPGSRVSAQPLRGLSSNSE